MEKIKIAYYLFFYKFYRLFRSLSEDGWADWKAVIVIQTLQWFLIAIILLQIEISHRASILLENNTKVWLILLAIALAILNYRIFLQKKKWKTYEHKFRKYSRQKNRIINFIIFCLVFAILIMLIFTYYQYSQVNWQKYR